MKIQVSKIIGEDELTFEIEGTDLKDGLEKASKFTDGSRKGNMPSACGLCKDKNLKLVSYRTREKNFLYVKIKCLAQGCYGYSELGLNTKTNEYYWKEWEKYVPQEIQSQMHKTVEFNNTPPKTLLEDTSDLPF